MVHPLWIYFQKRRNGNGKGQFFNLIRKKFRPVFDILWLTKKKLPSTTFSDNWLRNRFLLFREGVLNSQTVLLYWTKLNRFWKVRPMLDRIQSESMQTERHSNVSNSLTVVICFASQMISFYGKVLMRQMSRAEKFYYDDAYRNSNRLSHLQRK